ncbi:MAG: hypothetical protein M3273_09215 [Actinomycetota bacterium]|nr:hypothetical protein [Actinomycetota bacterium]
MLDVLGAFRCAACGETGAVLCSRCADAAPPCPRLEPVPPLASLTAAWHYEGPARTLVLGLKLRGMRINADPLAEAMCRNAWRDGLDGDVLCWVPGRRTDVRRRGYDHAEVLARAVAARLGLPAMALLRAAGPRQDQTTLTAAQRKSNLRGAFVARRAHGRVVLVDDVMTTGATICTSATALLRAGAGAVNALVGCRA